MLYLVSRERALQFQHPYYGRSPQLGRRKELVLWTSRVAEKLRSVNCTCLVSFLNTEIISRFCNATVHLAVSLLDYFMDSHNIADEQVHLVCLGCLCTAAKVEDLDPKVSASSEKKIVTFVNIVLSF